MNDSRELPASNDREPKGGKSEPHPDLAQLLVEQKIISSAQAQLAIADQEVSGMTLQEVLLARSWVDEATLYALAPWLKGSARADISKFIRKPNKSFEENRKQYQRILEQILGTSWD